MNKSAAANERFGASWGVARLTVCADFQAFAPVRTLVDPPACRQAAGTLAVILKTQHPRQKFLTNVYFRHRKT